MVTTGMAESHAHDRRRAIVSVTFDNLGEAAELEQGLWPANAPTGAHPSVTTALPHILQTLDQVGITATFFVEGINVEMYPAALRSIAAAGHEVALHAWRHEQWAALAEDQERQVLTRSVAAMRTLGIVPRGFRPPGGQLTAQSLAVFRDYGIRYCSPAGSAAHVVDGIAMLPFTWPLIDAYFFYPPFADLRVAHGDPPEPLPPAVLAQRLRAALNAVARDGGQLTLLFHPFLLVDDARRRVVHDLLGYVRALANAGRVWCAPCGSVAAQMAQP